MKNYISAKLTQATPMTLGDYNVHRDWILPENEDSDATGYLVVYPDGYETWCPAVQFEESNRLTDEMSFGMALEALRKGHNVARTGWNGKNMFLVYVPGTLGCNLKEGTPYYKALAYPLATIADIDPHIDMFTVRGTFQPGWQATQSDMLADDWVIVV